MKEKEERLYLYLEDNLRRQFLHPLLGLPGQGVVVHQLVPPFLHLWHQVVLTEQDAPMHRLDIPNLEDNISQDDRISSRG